MIRKLKVFFFNLRSIFNKKKNIKLGLYGPPNSGKCVTPETKIVLMNGEIKTINPFSNSLNIFKSGNNRVAYWIYETANGVQKNQIPTTQNIKHIIF